MDSEISKLEIRRAQSLKWKQKRTTSGYANDNYGKKKKKHHEE